MEFVDGAILALGLSGVGFAASAVIMWMSFQSSLNKITDPEKKKELKTELQGKILATIQLPSTVVVFALVTFFMATGRGILDDLFMAVSFNMGVTGLTVALSEGLMVRVDAARIVENPEHWGKHIVNLIIFELVAIYSVVIAFTALRADVDIDASLVNANYIMPIASLGTFLSVGLMQKANMEDTGRRFVMASPGVLASFIGFLIAYLYVLGVI